MVEKWPFLAVDLLAFRVDQLRLAVCRQEERRTVVHYRVGVESLAGPLDLGPATRVDRAITRRELQSVATIDHGTVAGPLHQGLHDGVRSGKRWPRLHYGVPGHRIRGHPCAPPALQLAVLRPRLFARLDLALGPRRVLSGRVLDDRAQGE